MSLRENFEFGGLKFASGWPTWVDDQTRSLIHLSYKLAKIGSFDAHAALRWFNSEGRIGVSKRTWHALPLLREKVDRRIIA